VLAKEMGDDVAYARLSAAAEQSYGPRYFGDEQEKFGWFFNNSEGFPRGQGSAMLMAAEIGRPGDWVRAFEVPHLNKFTAPTVEGIEFPSVGVSQAWNDPSSGTLWVSTYAATPSRKGQETSWGVTHLPDSGKVTMRLNGAPFQGFEAVGPNEIRIVSTVDAHEFEIVTGFRGQARAPKDDRERSGPGSLASAAAGTTFVPGAGEIRDVLASGSTCAGGCCCPA
jgi:hypothetical protein